MGTPKRMKAPLSLPPRSALYPLPPRAVGTADGESLTSYLNRLALVYRVPVTRLLQVMVERDGMANALARVPNIRSSFWQYAAMALNGSDMNALRLLDSVQAMTGRTDLAALTIHGLATGISSQRFLRKRIAWCPQCYNIWRHSKKIVYQPLLWMIASVTICVHHRRRLVERCFNPGCGKTQRVLGMQGVPPGYCMWCHAWLGSGPREKCTQQSELQWNEWIYQTMNELAAMPASMRRWDRVIQGIVAATEDMGGVERLAKAVWMTPGRLKRSLDVTDAAPFLGTILPLCYVLDCSPKTFMEDQDLRDARPISICRRVQSEMRLVNMRKPDKEFMKQFIRDCLAGKQQWISTSHHARQWGRDGQSLWNWYPEEITELVRRKKAQREEEFHHRREIVRREVQELLRAAKEEVVPLTRLRATARVTYPYMLRDPKNGRGFWEEICHTDEHAPSE